MDFTDKKIALLGFGIENRAILRYLKDKGAKISIRDRNDNLVISEPSVKAQLGRNYLQDLDKFDIIFRSPGIPYLTPEIQNAKQSGVIITSQTKLFFDECPAKIIGVTGTKGKGTTSTLIKTILDKAREKGEITSAVYLVGNIGVPPISIIDKVRPEDFVIIELSSFQLQDLEKSPHIAVVLGLHQDHLDHHKDTNEYFNSKKNIVRFQTAEDYAVINYDNEQSRAFGKDTAAKVYYFSKQKGEPKVDNIELSAIPAQIENILAASFVARTIGIKNDTITEGLRAFKPLPHRLEYVATVKGVRYYNDSFATTPEATIAAIQYFQEPITLIVGGSPKGADYSVLISEIKNNPNVRNIICIGEEGKRIFTMLQDVAVDKNFIEGGTTMKEIVDKSCDVTQKGGVVILSPGAASFDMFKNATDRGDQFKREVRLLRAK